MYQEANFRVKNIIRALKAKELEWDFPHRLLAGLKKPEKSRALGNQRVAARQSQIQILRPGHPPARLPGHGLDRVAALG